jgi:hypothetical protein
MAIDPQMLAQVLRTPESRDVTESPIVRAIILTDAANVADLVPALERPDTLEAYNARRISCLFDATAVSPLLTRLQTAGPNARKEGIEILWAILSGEDARTVRQVLTAVQDELDTLFEDTQPIPDQMPDHIERDFRGRICDLAYIAVQLMLSPEFDQSLFRSLDDQGRNDEIRRFKTRALAPRIA